VCITTMCCGKTAGPIEMPLGMWVGVGRCNHVLDVGPDPPRFSFAVTMTCFVALLHTVFETQRYCQKRVNRQHRGSKEGVCELKLNV